MNRPVTGKILVMVVGATAVGKTSIAVKLAQHYQCSIISADSRQCYRELGVATAKPDSNLLKKVQHFFVDSHSIKNPVTVADFEAYALDILGQIYRRDDYCIMVGGSGFYLKAVSDGLDQVPDIPSEIRQELEKKLLDQGLDSLVAKLKSLDRITAETLDLENPRRVIRALEVCLFTGKPYSSFLTGAKKTRPFITVKIGLRRDRKELYRRIDHRVEEMIEQGLFKEAGHLYRLRNEKPLQTVGYQEVFGYLDGLYNQQEAVRLLKRNSRRYAKRQLTWFGKDPSIRWFHADDLSAILEYLEQTVASTKS